MLMQAVQILSPNIMYEIQNPSSRVDLGPHNGFVDGKKPILFISTVFAQSFPQRVIFFKKGGTNRLFICSYGVQVQEINLIQIQTCFSGQFSISICLSCDSYTM